MGHTAPSDIVENVEAVAEDADDDLSCEPSPDTCLQCYTLPTISIVKMLPRIYN